MPELQWRNHDLRVPRYTGNELVEHLKENREGLLLTLPWSKSDQEGEGAILAIPPADHADFCPVQAIKEWRHHDDIEDDPLFRRINRWGTVEFDRLSDRAVALIVKRRADAAGFTAKGITALAGHSSRAGFATAAYETDVPEQSTQPHSRHKSMAMTKRYNRVVSAFKRNPAKGFLG